MAENLESKIRKVRVALGDCMRVVNDLVEPIVENLRLYGKEIHKLKKSDTVPVWGSTDAHSLVKATHLLRSCADFTRKELKIIWKSGELKEFPVIESRLFNAVGMLDISSKDLDILTREQDLWAVESPTRAGVELFWDHFGSRGHAWAGAMIAWVMLFYITANIPTVQVKLSEVQSRAWDEAWTDSDSYHIKMRIIDDVDRRAEREVVEVINSDGEVVYFTGPSSVTVYTTFTAPGKAHGAPEWQDMPRGKRAGKTYGFSRPLTGDEQRYVTNEILPRLSGGLTRANLLLIVQSIGKSDLQVVELKSQKEIEAFDEPEWNLIPGGIVVYKGKTFARALDKDELRYVKAVLKDDPRASIEEVASGLMLNVVKLSASGQKKEIEQRLTQNSSEISLRKKLWRL